MILHLFLLLLSICIGLQSTVTTAFVSPTKTHRNDLQRKDSSSTLRNHDRRTRFMSLCARRRVVNKKDEKYDDDDDEDDDDDLAPTVDISNFKAPQLSNSFGYGKGRSSPSIRTAMGMPGKSTAQVYVCTNCGGESVQWRGKCPTCQQWNTLQQFQVARKASPGRSNSMIPSFGLSSGTGGSTWLDGVGDSSLYQKPVPITQVDLTTPANARIEIPFDDEINAVLGGGLLKGSLILLGGDPGVGKSTLALQLANQVASHLSPPKVGIGMGKPESSKNPSSAAASTTPMGPVWYVSGEETMPQIAIRAQRLQSSLSDQLYLLSETNLNVLADQVVQLTHPSMSAPWNSNDDDSNQDAQMLRDLPPSLLIIDSIQTVYCDAASGGSPGGISQVRECMALLLRLAKSTHVPIVVIGHVTKSGDVAGPRMVEHMVDAVLYLEGSSDSGGSSVAAPYRWLRATKNRFGSTQVVGLYEFVQGQLRPSPELDSSATMPMEDLEGCAMSIAVEGLQRAMTIEVQALVALSPGGFGKKTVDGGGLSYQRLQLLLGVLQKHCGVFIGKSRDVYVNVVGLSSSATRKQQSAAALDLAVAVALTSSLASVPVRGDTVFLAQVGLLGELRSLSNMEARLLQAQRMGFSRAIVAGKSLRPGRRQYGIEYLECPTLRQALELGLTAGIPRKRRSSKAKSTDESTYKTPSPESLEELELQDIILDDEEDDYDDDIGGSFE